MSDLRVGEAECARCRCRYPFTMGSGCPWCTPASPPIAGVEADPSRGLRPLAPEGQDERQWMFQWCVPYKGWGRVTFCAMPLDRAEELWRRSHPDQHDYEVWTPLKIVRGLTGRAPAPQADAKAIPSPAPQAPPPEGVDVAAVLRLSSPWPLRDVLRKLIEASDILLGKHSYDGHGHELIVYARNVAKEIVAALSPQADAKAIPSPAPQAPPPEGNDRRLLANVICKAQIDGWTFGQAADAILAAGFRRPVSEPKHP